MNAKVSVFVICFETIRNSYLQVFFKISVLKKNSETYMKAPVLGSLFNKYNKD